MKNPLTRIKVDGVVRIQELDNVENQLELPHVASLAPMTMKPVAIYPVQVVVFYLESNGPVPDDQLESRCRELAGRLDQLGDPLLSIEQSWYAPADPPETSL
jgi:hypothetical protein